MENPYTPSWRNIIVPTDFSECSDRALALADWLAQQHGARITLLHVVEVPSGLALDTMVHPVEQAESSTVAHYLSGPAHERMRQQCSRLFGRQPHAVQVAFGSASETIVSVASEQQGDLIVMGTHGRTGIRHLLLGSVAERVVRSAACPVLVVRQPGHEKDGVARSQEEKSLEDEAQG
jgi:universal stress protein A